MHHAIAPSGCLLICAALCAPAMAIAQPAAVFSEADHLRGGYGPYRANNDLLYYHLDVRVDPDKQVLSGKNSIRFKMLKDGSRIQLDLVPAFQIEKILLDQPKGAPLPLHFERAAGRTVYVDFPKTLLKGSIYTIEFYYSGHPVEMGRFGGFVFRKDPMGRPLVNTACEEEGASVWWPNKDQWRDEVESMDISVEAPSDLVEVSGGRFQGKQELPDGYTRWNWHVNYPINNYDVSLNIGKYVHFDDRYGDLTLDYYVFPEDLDKAKRQFVQVKDMLNAFTLRFRRLSVSQGWLQARSKRCTRAWRIRPPSPTAIISRTATWAIPPRASPPASISSSCTKARMNGSATASPPRIARTCGSTRAGRTTARCCSSNTCGARGTRIIYINTGKDKVKNELPVISPEGVFSTPPPDQYKKGSLFLNTLRSVIDDDEQWFSLLRDYYQHFKYRTIMTTDMVAFFNRRTGRQLRPIFDEYLRHAAIPTLELRFDEPAHAVSYRWLAQEKGVCHAGARGSEGRLADHSRPRRAWQRMSTDMAKDDFDVATDLYYINVSKQ